MTRHPKLLTKASIMRYMIILFVLFPILLRAEISVRVLSHTQGSDCTGQIELTAEGSAGPFEVRLTGPSSEVVNNVNGTIMFIDLCEGSYLIEVVSELIPSCPKLLEANVANLGGGFLNKDPDQTDVLLGQQMQSKNTDQALHTAVPFSMKVFPNPFKQSINIMLNAPQETSRIVVLNSLGQEVASIITENQRFFQIDLSREGAAMFIVNAFDRNGEIKATEQVIRMD